MSLWSNLKSRNRKAKQRASRTRCLESLEDRRLLVIAANWLNFCVCSEPADETPFHSTGRSRGTGNGSASVAAPGWRPGLTNNSGTNPHPVVHFWDMDGIGDPAVYVGPTDYIKATLSLSVTGTPQPSTDPKQVVYWGNQEVTGSDDVVFSFQLDASSVEQTGRYSSWLKIEYFHSDNSSAGTTYEGYGPDIDVVNRSESEFGNRWWLEGLDRLYPQVDTNDDFPDGALFVRDDGTPFWHAYYNGVTFQSADGDPEFAALSWDAVGQQYTLESRDGSKRVFDAAGFLTSRVDVFGNTTTYEYNGSGQIEKIEDQADRQIRFEYFTSGDFTGQLKLMREVLTLSGSTIVTSLDTEYAYEMRSTDIFTLSSVTHPDPDGSGPLPSPRSEYTYISYDTGFNWLLASMTEPGSPAQPRSTKRFTYDFAGGLDTTTYADGTVETLDSIQTLLLPDTRVVGIAANKATFRTSLPSGSETDRAGNEKTFQVNRLGSISQTIDQAGHQVDYNRSASFNLLESIVEEDPDGQAPVNNLVTTMEYDQNNHIDLRKTIWPDGSFRKWDNYDAKHRPVDFTDELGRLTHYYYDPSSANPLPLFVQQVIGTQDNVSYNSSDGSTSGVSDDLVWSFKFSTTSSPGNNIPAGLVLSAFDPLGRKTVYDYVTASEATTLAQRGQLDYIDLPKVAGETNAPRVDYAYDANGFVSSVTATGDGGISKATEYLHDSFGRLHSVTLPDPDGAGTEYTKRPKYQDFYDVAGRLIATAEPDVSIIPGSSSAPTASPTSLSVSVSLNAGHSEIDLTQYFSDDVDSDFGLTYLVTTPASNNTPDVFQGIYQPANRPGVLVLDTKYNASSGDLQVKAVDSHGNVSSNALTITVTVNSAPEFILNSTTTDSQRKPSLAPMPDGGFAAAWLEKNVSTNKYKVKARVFGPDGRAVTSEVTVQGSYDSTSSTYPPSIAVTEDDHIVVAWHEDTDPSATEVYDTFFSRFTLGLAIEYESDGTTPKHQRVAIPSDLNYDQYVPVLAPLPGGGFIAAFYGGSTGVPQSDVWFRRFGANAEVLDNNQIRANVVTTNAQYRPAIDVARDGSFVIAWQGNGTEDANGVYARKFGADGTALLATESMVYQDALLSESENQADADVAALVDGSFVIVWSSDESTSGTDIDVFYRRMDAEGFLVGNSRIEVSSDSGGTTDQDEPEVTALRDGGFMVSWQAADSSGWGVYARPYTATYAAQSQFAVNVTSSGHTSGDQYFSDLIVNPDGNLTFAWEGSGTGDGQGIFARYYPYMSAPAPGPFRVTNVEMERVQRNKLDSFIVTFSEAIDGNTTTSLNGSDFVLKDSTNTTVALHGTTPVERISATQALVRLAAPISVTGTYSLTVLPSIKRLSDGAWVNGDGDGTSNETPDDQFNWTFWYANGKITTLQYDTEGRIVSEVDAFGGRTTYDYGRLGNIESVVDPLGRTTLYAYDDRGLLETLTLPDPDGPSGLSSPVYEYQYDEGGQLQTMLDPFDAPTDYEYDARHRLIEVQSPDPDGGLSLPRLKLQYRYTKAGELAVVTDQLGRMYTSTYDDAGRLVKSSLVADTVTVAKDEQDVTTYSPNISNWTYASGVTGAVNSDHRVSDTTSLCTCTATWEISGLTKDKTYEVFVTWVADSTYAEDAPYTVYDGTTAGQNLGTFTVDQTKSPDPRTSVYTDVANVKWHSLGDFKVTNGTTPGTGKLTVTLKNTVNGKVSADALRVVESTPTRYTYERDITDPKIRINKTKDALNNITEERFDARDRRTDIYLPNPSSGAADQSGPHTSFTYDALGNLKTLTDPVSNLTTWNYDQLNRVTSEVDDLSNSRQFKYDDASNITKLIDRLGRVRTFSFDRVSRMTREQWFTDINDSSANRTLSYIFNSVGSLTGVTDRDASSAAVGADYSFAYDNLDRVTQSTTDLVGMSTSQLVFQEFAYDANSRRTEAKASSGSALGSATKDYKNTYVYNAAGQLDYLTQQGQSGGNTVAEKYVDYAYDSEGALSTVTRYKALAGGITNEGIKTTYARDTLGRVTSISHADGGTVRASYGYTYDAIGRIRSMDALGTSEDINSYTYDASGQLTIVDRNTGTDESYTFDANGNRTNVGGTNWTVDDDNRIDRDGTYEYQYDAEGNLYRRVTLVGGAAIGATTEYSYDHRNRLVKVAESFSPGGTPSKWTEYAYDAFDRRVMKSVNTNVTTTPIDRYEFYIWDGDDVVLDFVDADGGTSPSASLDKRYLHGLAIDEILAQEPVGGATAWHLADVQGSVRDLADGDGGLVSGSHVEYNSYGKVLSGTPGRFAYTGQEYDGDAGLYYYNARWYNANTGKFQTKDPIGFAGGDSNQYRYVWNSATNFVDPSGLANLWNPITWGIPNPQQSWADFVTFNPFDAQNVAAMSALPGAYLQTAQNGDQMRSLEAFVDGYTPIVDPFASYGFYNPNDGVNAQSQVIGGFTRDLMLFVAGAKSPGFPTWIKNPIGYELGSTTVPASVWGQIRTMSVLQRAAYLRKAYPLTAPFRGFASFQFFKTFSTGLTPGGYFFLAGFFRGMDMNLKNTWCP